MYSIVAKGEYWIPTVPTLCCNLFCYWNDSAMFSNKRVKVWEQARSWTYLSIETSLWILRFAVNNSYQFLIIYPSFVCTDRFLHIKADWSQTQNPVNTDIWTCKSVHVKTRSQNLNIQSLFIQCTVDLVYYLDCEFCLVYKGQPLKEKDHCQTCCQQECINHKRTLISNIIKGTDN